MVIWLIGMSRAGKTSIGKEVYRLIKTRRPNVVFLDGDIVRDIMGNDLGHTLADRKKNADRICRLCKNLDDQGIDVICAILSIFPESQQWNREHLKKYFEVYIRVSFERLLERDAKGLYRKALAGEVENVVGVDLDFPEPANPDLVVNNDSPLEDFSELARSVISALPWQEDR